MNLHWRLLSKQHFKTAIHFSGQPCAVSAIGRGWFKINKCRTLVIFAPQSKQLLILPHTCTEPHVLAVILFNILPIEDQKTPSFSKWNYFCGFCKIVPSKKPKKMHIYFWKKEGVLSEDVAYGWGGPVCPLTTWSWLPRTSLLSIILSLSYRQTWGIAEFAPVNSLVNPVGAVTLTEITP
jgi:hypothetical protein